MIMGAHVLCKHEVGVRSSHPPPSLCRRIIMSHGGKGDKPRPFSVPKEQFDKNFEAIFGKKKPAPQSQSDKQKDNK